MPDMPNNHHELPSPTIKQVELSHGFITSNGNTHKFDCDSPTSVLTQITCSTIEVNVTSAFHEQVSSQESAPSETLGENKVRNLSLNSSQHGHNAVTSEPGVTDQELPTNAVPLKGSMNSREEAMKSSFIDILKGYEKLHPDIAGPEVQTPTQAINKDWKAPGEISAPSNLISINELSTKQTYISTVKGQSDTEHDRARDQSIAINSRGHDNQILELTDSKLGIQNMTLPSVSTSVFDTENIDRTVPSSVEPQPEVPVSKSKQVKSSILELFLGNQNEVSAATIPKSSPSRQVEAIQTSLLSPVPQTSADPLNPDLDSIFGFEDASQNRLAARFIQAMDDLGDPELHLDITDQSNSHDGTEINKFQTGISSGEFLIPDKTVHIVSSISGTNMQDMFPHGSSSTNELVSGTTGLTPVNMSHSDINYSDYHIESKSVSNASLTACKTTCAIEPASVNSSCINTVLQGQAATQHNEILEIKTDTFKAGNETIGIYPHKCLPNETQLNTECQVGVDSVVGVVPNKEFNQITSSYSDKIIRDVDVTWEYLSDDADIDSCVKRSQPDSTLFHEVNVSSSSDTASEVNTTIDGIPNKNTKYTVYRKNASRKDNTIAAKSSLTVQTQLDSGKNSSNVRPCEMNSASKQIMTYESNLSPNTSTQHKLISSTMPYKNSTNYLKENENIQCSLADKSLFKQGSTGMLESHSSQCKTGNKLEHEKTGLLIKSKSEKGSSEISKLSSDSITLEATNVTSTNTISKNLESSENSRGQSYLQDQYEKHGNDTHVHTVTNIENGNYMSYLGIQAHTDQDLNIPQPITCSNISHSDIATKVYCNPDKSDSIQVEIQTAYGPCPDITSTNTLNCGEQDTCSLIAGIDSGSEQVKPSERLIEVGRPLIKDISSTDDDNDEILIASDRQSNMGRKKPKRRAKSDNVASDAEIDNNVVFQKTSEHRESENNTNSSPLTSGLKDIPKVASFDPPARSGASDIPSLLPNDASVLSIQPGSQPDIGSNIAIDMSNKELQSNGKNAHAITPDVDGATLVSDNDIQRGNSDERENSETSLDDILLGPEYQDDTYGASDDSSDLSLSDIEQNNNTLDALEELDEPEEDLNISIGMPYKDISLTQLESVEKTEESIELENSNKAPAGTDTLRDKLPESNLDSDNIQESKIFNEDQTKELPLPDIPKDESTKETIDNGSASQVPQIDKVDGAENRTNTVQNVESTNAFHETDIDIATSQSSDQIEKEIFISEDRTEDYHGISGLLIAGTSTPVKSATSKDVMQVRTTSIDSGDESLPNSYSEQNSDYDGYYSDEMYDNVPCGNDPRYSTFSNLSELEFGQDESNSVSTPHNDQENGEVKTIDDTEAVQHDNVIHRRTHIETQQSVVSSTGESECDSDLINEALDEAFDMLDENPSPSINDTESFENFEIYVPPRDDSDEDGEDFEDNEMVVYGDYELGDNESCVRNCHILYVIPEEESEQVDVMVAIEGEQTEPLEEFAKKLIENVQRKLSEEDDVPVNPENMESPDDHRISNFEEQDQGDIVFKDDNAPRKDVFEKDNDTAMSTLAANKEVSSNTVDSKEELDNSNFQRKLSEEDDIPVNPENMESLDEHRVSNFEEQDQGEKVFEDDNAPGKDVFEKDNDTAMSPLAANKEVSSNTVDSKEELDNSNVQRKLSEEDDVPVNPENMESLDEHRVSSFEEQDWGEKVFEDDNAPGKDVFEKDNDTAMSTLAANKEVSSNTVDSKEELDNSNAFSPIAAVDQHAIDNYDNVTIDSHIPTVHLDETGNNVAEPEQIEHSKTLTYSIEDVQDPTTIEKEVIETKEIIVERTEEVTTQENVTLDLNNSKEIETAIVITEKEKNDTSEQQNNSEEHDPVITTMISKEIETIQESGEVEVIGNMSTETTGSTEISEINIEELETKPDDDTNVPVYEVPPRSQDVLDEELQVDDSPTVSSESINMETVSAQGSENVINLDEQAQADNLLDEIQSEYPSVKIPEITVEEHSISKFANSDIVSQNEETVLSLGNDVDDQKEKKNDPRLEVIVATQAIEDDNQNEVTTNESVPGKSVIKPPIAPKPISFKAVSETSNDKETPSLDLNPSSDTIMPIDIENDLDNDPVVPVKPKVGPPVPPKPPSHKRPLGRSLQQARGPWTRSEPNLITSNTDIDIEPDPKSASKESLNMTLKKTTESVTVQPYDERGSKISLARETLELTTSDIKAVSAFMENNCRTMPTHQRNMRLAQMRANNVINAIIT
ncbi:unnamed protein product, partial [Owenia fusiformis]